jgi:peptidoglycan/LPS O-acetylase OafA/YrhL
MYYLAIIYYLWQDGTGHRYWLGDAKSISSYNVASNFFFVHGAVPSWINSLVPGGWSITVEMTFYAFVPLLIKKIKNLNQAVIFTLCAFMFSLILKIVLYEIPLIDNVKLWKDFIGLYFPSQLPIFGLGIIAYFVIIEKDRKLSSFSMLATALLFVGQSIWGVLLPGYFISSIAFLILIIAISQIQPILFVNKFTIFLGKISYSAYLVHFAILYFLTKINFVDFISGDNLIFSFLNFACRLFCVMALTISVSYFFYKVIEIPFQNFGKSIINYLDKFSFRESLRLDKMRLIKNRG